jgi:inhibitor of cysteine peptidase
MKKLILHFFAIVLISCSSQEDIKGDYYEVSANETFEVSLNSNPTTGYSWKWLNKPNKLVDKVSMNYIAMEVKKGIVGSGGSEIWKFKGTKSGIDTLTLEYCRPWDANSTVQTKKIIVKVK